jgi:hypothetical protein
VKREGAANVLAIIVAKIAYIPRCSGILPRMFHPIKTRGT